MHVFTIGYEGSTQAELIAVLKAAHVALIADVRAVPLSRRPGFSKNILAGGLREARIDYVGLKALGTPPEGREAARRATTPGWPKSMPGSWSCRKRSCKAPGCRRWRASGRRLCSASSGIPMAAIARSSSTR